MAPFWHEATTIKPFELHTCNLNQIQQLVIIITPGPESKNLLKWVIKLLKLEKDADIQKPASASPRTSLKRVFFFRPKS